MNGLHSDEVQKLNPRILASTLNTPLRDIIGILEDGVATGTFRHRFHILCPVEDAGISWQESLGELTESFACDLCDEGSHPLTPNEVQVRYALVRPPTQQE